MCLFLTLPPPALVLAQEKLLPVFHFNRLTAPDSLPTSDMLARVSRDSKGFVWIGTENGLSRYDGYSFKHYRNRSDDSSSLPFNAIIMVKEDSHKRLWVGTFDAGLSLYDPDRDCFVNFRPRPGDSTWLQTRIVFSMAEDSSGVLWLGTGLSGIVRIDLPEMAGPKDYDTITRGVRFTSYPLGTRDNAGYDIAVRRDGRILVASDSGLLVLDRNTGSVSRPDLPGRAGRRLHSVLAYRLALDHERNLWLGTNEGLFKINWENGSVLNYRHNKDDSLSITWDDIQDLAVDRRGNLWLASAQGVDLYSPGTGKRVPYLASGQTPQGSAAMALSVDNTGTLWMNSATEGVFRLSEKSRRLLHYSIRQPNGAPRKLESIERSPDGTFWISARGRLFRLNIHALQVMESIDVTHGAKLRGDISNKKGTCLAKDGYLWYGTWGPGLFEVDLVKRKVRNYRYPNPLETESIIVMALGRGSGDSLWIAALHDGLMSFDPISGTFTRVLFGRDRRAFDVTTDRAGRVWLATQGSGLYVLDPATGAIDHLVHDVSNPRSLSHDRTLNVFEDPSGRIWVGAVNVINLWNPQSRSFLRYSNPAFPNANSVDVVGADRKGRLWVSYDGKELAALDPSTGLFINFDPSDGAAGGGIDMENLEDGRVLLTGSGGMNIFHPDSVLDIHRTPPPLVLTRMAINDRPVVLPASAGGSDALRLSYDQDVIEFEYAALDLDAPQLVEYRYKLEGLEKEWVASEARRYVRYAGLPPGEYLFRLKAVSSRGEWPDQEITLALRITPPWWQSRWAYGGYAIILIVLVVAAYRLRLKQLQLKQEAEMEHFQADRLAEVDKLKTRFFANISHEFRTPLTLIIGPAGQLLDRIADTDHRHRLQLIKENAQRLLGLVNQLLEFSRLESGKMSLQVCSTDVFGSLQGTVMSFESWAERKRIALDFHADAESIQGYFDPDKLKTIVNNLMSNALKFTPEGGRVTVTVAQFSVQKSELRDQTSIPRSGIAITVSDTGPGIPAEHLPHIFDRFYRADQTHTTEGTGIGLALTKELVELHHGRITAHSTPGEGSVFTVTLPIEESAYQRDEIIASHLPGTMLEHLPVVVPPSEDVDFPASQPSNGKPIVLVVEDNSDLRRYIREFLEKDYTVHEAQNGKEGYDQAIEIVPDIVISDLMMPKMDGVELCRGLKQDERTSHIPVILLTARSDTDSKIAGLDTGADDYITKPFDSSELMARIRNLIEQRRRLRARFSSGLVLKPGEVAVTSLDEALLKKIMEIVEKNLSDEHFGVDELAREACLSRRHLYRKLHALTNLTPAEFVQYIRLQRARELLEKKAGSVTEIAFQVGFGNPAYFSTCFRERFGATPSEVRNKNP